MTGIGSQKLWRATYFGWLWKAKLATTKERKVPAHRAIRKL
jgi:hypothetical protein